MSSFCGSIPMTLNLKLQELKMNIHKNKKKYNNAYKNIYKSIPKITNQLSVLKAKTKILSKSLNKISDLSENSSYYNSLTNSNQFHSKIIPKGYSNNNYQIKSKFDNLLQNNYSKNFVCNKTSNEYQQTKSIIKNNISENESNDKYNIIGKTIKSYEQRLSKLNSQLAEKTNMINRMKIIIDKTNNELNKKKFENSALQTEIQQLKKKFKEEKKTEGNIYVKLKKKQIYHKKNNSNIVDFSYKDIIEINKKMDILLKKNQNNLEKFKHIIKVNKLIN